MNIIRNILNIKSPWWYYFEVTITANVIPVLFMVLVFIGKLEDEWPNYYEDFNAWFWPAFLMHVGLAVLIGLLIIYHDMVDHPEFFMEVTQWTGRKK